MNDMVTFRHIFIDTPQLTTKEDRDKAAKHADDILKELKAGAAFTDLVMKYSEDNTVQVQRRAVSAASSATTTQNRQAFGAAFFDALFKMKKGDTSGVLQSNLGFHIVQVTDTHGCASARARRQDPAAETRSRCRTP